MASEPALPPPIVLLVEPSGPKHQHAEVVTRAGFRVVRLPPEEVTPPQILDVGPAIIAVELDGANAGDALDLAPRLRADARARSIPVIVYGHGLDASDIERAARGGAMWLQLEPSDGLKLVAAIRGVLTASGIVVKET